MSLNALGDKKRRKMSAAVGEDIERAWTWSHAAHWVWTGRTAEDVHFLYDTRTGEVEWEYPPQHISSCPALKIQGS